RYSASVGNFQRYSARRVLRIAIVFAVVLGVLRPGTAVEPGIPAEPAPIQGLPVLPQQPQVPQPPARPAPAHAAPALPPANLPQYELDIAFDNTTHRAKIRERVTWTNNTHAATNQLAFNFYPHFQVPAGEALLFAKTLELLRLQPSLGIDRDGKMGDVKL